MGPLPRLVVFSCEITSRGDRHHLRYLDQADIAAVLFESAHLGNSVVMPKLDGGFWYLWFNRIP
jgi:hypothetical protein